MVRYQSVTMPLIEELPQSLHNNEPEINVEDVSGYEGFVALLVDSLKGNQRL